MPWDPTDTRPWEGSLRLETEVLSRVHEDVQAGPGQHQRVRAGRLTQAHVAAVAAERGSGRGGARQLVGDWKEFGSCLEKTGGF